MATCERLTAAQVEYDRVRIDQLDRILRFDVRDSLRLSPELRKEQEEKTEQERSHKQRVIRGKFEVGVHS